MPFVPSTPDTGAQTTVPTPPPAAPVAPPEAATPPAAAAPAPPSTAAQWTALTRKEAAAVAKLQEASAMKAAAEADKAEAAKLRQESFDWKEAFLKDPVGTLSKTGLSYSQLTDIVMNDGKIPVEQQLTEVRQEFSSWKQQQAEAEAKRIKDAADAEIAQRHADLEAMVQAVRANVAQLTSNAEQFPLINKFQSQELVLATIDRNFNETGKIMAEEDAAKLVEAHHRKQVEEAFALVAPKPSPPATPQANRFSSRPQAPALTNRVASPSTSSARQSNNVDDRIKKARIKFGF